MYRNDTLISTVNYANCESSIQFNKNGTYVEYNHVYESAGSDTTSGNYSISNNTISFSITDHQGYLKGVIIPTPGQFFIGGQLNELNVATNSDWLEQLSSTTLSVHAVVTSTPSTNGSSTVYKAIIYETSTR